jgi:hypothetical protein
MISCRPTVADRCLSRGIVPRGVQATLSVIVVVMNRSEEVEHVRPVTIIAIDATDLRRVGRRSCRLRVMEGRAFAKARAILPVREHALSFRELMVNRHGGRDPMANEFLCVAFAM